MWPNKPMIDTSRINTYEAQTTRNEETKEEVAPHYLHKSFPNQTTSEEIDAGLRVIVSRMIKKEEAKILGREVKFFSDASTCLKKPLPESAAGESEKPNNKPKNTLLPHYLHSSFPNPTTPEEIDGEVRKIVGRMIKEAEVNAE